MTSLPFVLFPVYMIKNVLSDAEPINPLGFLKGAVSYRFSQGLLTLMCNNSELKADITFFFFLLRRQTFLII